MKEFILLISLNVCACQLNSNNDHTGSINPSDQFGNELNAKCKGPPWWQCFQHLVPCLQAEELLTYSHEVMLVLLKNSQLSFFCGTFPRNVIV